MFALANNAKENEAREQIRLTLTGSSAGLEHRCLAPAR